MHQGFCNTVCRVFPRPFTHGGLVPPYGGTSAGGLMREDIDLMGGT